MPAVSELLTDEMKAVTGSLEEEKGLRMTAEREASEVLITCCYSSMCLDGLYCMVFQ